MGDWFKSAFENVFSFFHVWLTWMVTSIINGIGTFFSQLFSVVKDTASWVINSIIDAVTGLFNFLAQVFRDIIQGLIDAIKFLFGPLLKFFDGLGYFLFQALMIIVWVLKVILGLIGIVFSIIGGFFATIFSFVNWSGSVTTLPTAYSGGFNMFLNAFNTMGGSTFAYVFAVILWLVTVYIIFKILNR